MVAAYEKFISTFPTNERVPQAYLRIAENQARANDFETAAKTYQKIIDRNEPAYASSALVSRADLWVKAANLLTRNYSALNEADRGKWKKYLESAEADNVQLLQKYADQPASGKALENLVEIVQMRQRADLVKKEELTAYFDGLAKKFSDPSMQARVKLVQAGLPFAEGDYAAALKIFKDVLANQPEVKMSAGDLGRYGTLLLAGNQLDEAAAQFEKLLQDYPYNPQNRANEGALIDGNHGLGVVWMKKNDLAKAETYFSTLKKQYPFYATVLKSGRVPQAWKILEAEYGIGRAWLAAGKGVDATKTFLSVYVSEAERLAETQAEKAAIYKIRALAAFAYAESLEKAGKLLPTDGDDRANAAFNYVIVHDRFGGVNPELAAEGLWRGGQIFQKGNKAKEAREAYTALVKNYPKSPFASKAQEALKSLPAAP
jgi:TolA-binding protein